MTYNILAQGHVIVLSKIYQKRLLPESKVAAIFNSAPTLSSKLILRIAFPLYCPKEILNKLKKMIGTFIGVRKSSYLKHLIK